MERYNAQSPTNTQDTKPTAEELAQQAHTVRQPTPVRPVSQLPTAMEHTATPAPGRQMRSHGPTDIISLFNRLSPPDAVWWKPLANLANSFVPIANETPSTEDNEVASITGSARLHDHTSGTESGTASGFQSEHSAFSIYLKDSRTQPSELFIPDRSRDTLTTRTTSKFGLLKNGHEASLVRIETFIPYFEKDMYIIDHHNGDVYLWDQETNDLEPLALQASTTPFSMDAAKMLTKTATNARWLALQNWSLSHSSSRSSRALTRGPSRNSHYGTPKGTPWINLEDLTLEPTLHNISINPSSMDRPADGTIFESNHLAEIADVRSKLIHNLAKVSKTYCTGFMPSY